MHGPTDDTASDSHRQLSRFWIGDAPDWDEKFGRILRLTAMIGAIVGCALCAAIILLFLFSISLMFWQDLVKEHFPATLGLVGAAVTSFAVVVFLRQTEGAIEFQAFGMKFQGAAGQVVLWAFCVGVLVLCTKLLW